MEIEIKVVAKADTFSTLFFNGCAMLCSMIYADGEYRCACSVLPVHLHTCQKLVLVAPSLRACAVHQALEPNSYSDNRSAAPHKTFFSMLNPPEVI